VTRKPSRARGLPEFEFSIGVEYRYRVNLERIDEMFAEEIAADVARGRDREDVLRETFYELCGTWAERDHATNGELIERIDETEDFDVYGEWRKAVGD
jgi:hypothetical protein